MVSFIKYLAVISFITVLTFSQSEDILQKESELTSIKTEINKHYFQYIHGLVTSIEEKQEK